MRVAVIGIGSNSVRLLVADCQDGNYRVVLRDRCGTRLFAGLQGGALSKESLEGSCTAACGMALQARALGAANTYAFATSAARDAENGQELRDMLLERAEIELDICTGEEEARLSYYGAARPGLCGLIDIGGGSTEWTIGRDGVPLAAVSLQMGAVRLHQASNIACAGDLPAVVARAQAALSDGLDALSATPRPTQWIGVGGTFTTLAAMDMQLPTFDRSLVEGYVLSEERVWPWARALADMPVELRRTLPGLQPQRADIVAHGIAILLACFRLLGLQSITVSDQGNLDGYLRAKLRGLA
jgi:exopolyphosphatase/guanosine-5'-triphosphate,3'-diphosphate pyrophosphatase